MTGCPECDDPHGWITTTRGLVPCPQCLPSTHDRWSAGCYGIAAECDPLCAEVLRLEFAHARQLGRNAEVET